MARFIPHLRARGIVPIVSVQDPLLPLLQHLSPDTPLLGENRSPGAFPGAFDAHCPMMSLPLALHTTLATIPAAHGYLSADPARRAAFEARLGPRSKPRVGLVWSGNPAHDHDHKRSLRFDQMAPVLTDAVEWVCLQKVIRANELETVAAFGRVSTHGEVLGDFADTAGLIEALDLVITVDTSVAHLAGAMGKPVWIMITANPDWRWGLHRTDSPWYASARLFRQARLDDWDSVLDAVRLALGQTFGNAG